MNSKVLLLAAAAALLVLGAPKPAAKAMTAMIPTIDEDETGVAQVREPQRERVRSARVHSSGSRNDDGMRKSGAGSSSSSKAASSSRSSGAGGGKSISKTVGTSSVAGGPVGVSSVGGGRSVNGRKVGDKVRRPEQPGAPTAPGRPTKPDVVVVVAPAPTDNIDSGCDWPIRKGIRSGGPDWCR
jgi:hypothetical protein